MDTALADKLLIRALAERGAAWHGCHFLAPMER